MAKVADLKVPSWIDRVELRTYKNRRDFYESIGLRWVINEPHFEVMEQLKKFYVVEQEEGKHSFTVIKMNELGEQMLEVKKSLPSGSRIIFQ